MKYLVPLILLSVLVGCVGGMLEPEIDVYSKPMPPEGATPEELMPEVLNGTAVLKTESIPKTPVGDGSGLKAIYQNFSVTILKFRTEQEAIGMVSHTDNLIEQGGNYVKRNYIFGDKAWLEYEFKGISVEEGLEFTTVETGMVWARGKFVFMVQVTGDDSHLRRSVVDGIGY